METNTFDSFIPQEYKDKIVPLDNFAEMQCKWHNEVKGNLPDVDCPECLNRGEFMMLSDSGEHVIRECKCMIQRRYIWSMKKAGLGELYRKCTFDNYKTDTDWRDRAKKMAMYYLKMPENKWLLFSGASGCGKTMLCTAICSELAKQGRTIKYVEWKRLLALLSQNRFNEAGQSRLLNEMQDVDVLYLDDFLKTPHNVRPSDEALSYALEVINARYIRDKKTILSSEFTSQDLLAFDEALGGRIVEKAYKIQIKCGEGRNYRIQQEQET